MAEVMILAVIQARMSSKRLPGKVLLPVDGKPLLVHLVDLVKMTKLIDQSIVATSSDYTDDIIEKVCRAGGINYYRGELNDVFSRFYDINQLWKPAHIVRLTADCPTIPPDHIDEVISWHVLGGYDYTRDYEYPDGWDTEVISHSAWYRAGKMPLDAYEMEHVTPIFYKHPELFKLGRYENTVNQGHIKVSIDTEEEYEILCRSFQSQSNFSTAPLK